MVLGRGGAVSYERGTPVHSLLEPLPNVDLAYRGISLIRKRPPPYDPPMALGMVLLQGPTGWRFLVSEVPLHRVYSKAKTRTALVISSHIV